MLITSLDNKKIKEVIKLKEKKHRDQTDNYIVETDHLIKEAIKAGVLLELYFVNNNTYETDAIAYEVTPQVMKKISAIENSKVLGICKKVTSIGLVGQRYLLLDGIQDPGNLGTILRSALAFDVDTVVLGDKTCDLYNEKTIRSSEGAFFYLNIVKMDLKETIKELKEKKIIVFGTDVIKGNNIKEIANTSSYGLVIGSEGSGISFDIKKLCDQNLYIKMNNNQESLNVAIATSILLYELRR